MRKTPLILMAAALPMAVNAANTEFSYGGYIKFDAMYSQYSDGDMTAASGGRDFYIPSTIPTSNNTAEETSSVDFNARSSRFNFKTDTSLDNGQNISTFVEMDFLLTGDGNEVVSNSYNPRLRHAFIKTGNLLVGQTWSTFMNVDALPETVDFLGVSDGTVFARQSQVRYTNGGLQVALENPETTVVGVGATDDSGIPDIVARYNFKAGKNAFTVAAIGRQLAIQDGVKGGVDESTMGFGINVSGKIALGQDDLKFSYTTGQVARYVGLASAADAMRDADGDLQATDVSAAFIGYRHFWNDQLRSTIAYSMLDADYDSDNVADTTEASSVRLNLMYSPVAKLTYGVELSKATHKLDNDAEGDLTRLHFTTKYAF
ncbi:DcaP family trimeric outer membrane transporter [Bacterioplanoides pacificum]|uniref:DcaP family trimeric outer membrane transporter n=1 Tax=Bacterioplanoides pacificum TaxID=1171596 RepID=A0ABV7VN46_9GAMM